MKTTTKIAFLMATVISLSGCVGSNAVTEKLMGFNVKVVDNRYARAGVNFLLSPVYGFTLVADLFVVNSIEFWSGHNPINGKPHIFDTKTETYLEVNDKVDSSLHDAPIDPLTMTTPNAGTIRYIDENTIEMEVVLNDGNTSTVVGIKQGNHIRYYIDDILISETTIDALQSEFS
ncbi:hypothetical protein BCU70_04050 [Vibrio sp. 10N.286.49.C2]|uniref:DUF3332 family protein n=1 Tax=unclassified Vibrio TaxID=2614977 RepID=UPI000C847AFF|nr:MULTISPECIES: DUF3332 family protein [unclassified Vibrio]PMH36766.1 hypothetical protein BCU70_04050 [Vibrio sp. 10N.286.49.C2]PMH54754.1 hypothetical protein BCU66_10665 [Vibrio sp. 10N.286.49.B1]PMH82005.1 hypothetical protein BCU58_19615 [Vibrio sp. 10N.286.48.B7]